MSATVPIKHRPITGRTVLVCLIAFFGVVGAVNAVMIHAATSTFGGVDTENAYKAGLNFSRDIANARAQDARHWRVDGSIRRDASGMVTANIQVKDRTGNVVPGIAIAGRLTHPTNRKLDRAFDFAQMSAGDFRGTANATPGQWDFVVEIERDAEIAFQSRSRVVLK